MVRIGARSFLDLVKHDSIRVVFWCYLLCWPGCSRTHSVRKEKATNHSVWRLFDAGLKWWLSTVSNNGKSTLDGSQLCGSSQVEGRKSRCLRLRLLVPQCWKTLFTVSVCVVSSITRWLFPGHDEYIGAFFPDLLAGSSSARALSQGVQWMVFVVGEIGAPSNSFAPLVSVPVHKQGKAKRMPRPPATKRAQEAVCLGVVDDASLELFCIQCD